MKFLEGGKENNTLLENYIDSNQINQKLINIFANKNFDLI